MGSDLPRWLARPAAAAYLDLTEVAFTQRVQAKKLPAPSDHLGPRCLRWDRHKLDEVMAKSSASPPSTGAAGLAEAILKAGRPNRHATAR
jgi:hypothetical protein